MAEKRYVVKLSAAERETLLDVIHAQRMCRQKRTRAQILLMVDEGEFGPQWTDAQAAAAYHCGVHLPGQLRQRLVEHGFEATLERKPQARPSRPRKLDAAGERELLAVAQSAPPAGRVRWTLRLLAGRLVELELVDGTISYETVRAALKKTSSRPTARSVG